MSKERGIDEQLMKKNDKYKYKYKNIINMKINMKKISIKIKVNDMKKIFNTLQRKAKKSNKMSKKKIKQKYESIV